MRAEGGTCLPAGRLDLIPGIGTSRTPCLRPILGIFRVFSRAVWWEMILDGSA